MNDLEKIMSALAQGYQVLSKAMKQKPSKEGFQLVLLMLGDDGIQACVLVANQGPEAIALTMAKIILEKQTQKALKGAKLNRLMALNNSCPEGYLKKGGKCKKCEKGEKFNPHKALFTPAAYFKNGGINKMFLGGLTTAIGAIGSVANSVKNTIGNKKQQLPTQPVETTQPTDWATQLEQKQQANTNAIAAATQNGMLQAQQFLTGLNNLALVATTDAAMNNINNPNNFLANLRKLKNIPTWIK